MRPKTAIERAVLEVCSLLLEGHYYVGIWKEKDITSVYFRHPNENQVRIEINETDDKIRLFVNDKIQKIL